MTIETIALPHATLPSYDRTVFRLLKTWFNTREGHGGEEGRAGLSRAQSSAGGAVTRVASALTGLVKGTHSMDPYESRLLVAYFIFSVIEVEF